MATTAASGVVARTLFSRLNSIPIEYPFAFGVAFSGVKTSVSDLLVQKVVEQRETIDWKRNSAFAAFGFIYLGGVQYALYVPVFGRLFPAAAAFVQKPLQQKIRDVRGMASLVAQVFLDQCVHHPLMYFPAFYCTKEFVMRDKPDFRRVLNEYRTNIYEDLHALWKIWVPAMAVNFAFCPMWARIPFVASVSLLWTMILSAMRGGDIAHASDIVGGAVTGATLHMMEEGLHAHHLFTDQLDLEQGKSHFILTASGRDKPGWVALLSRAIADAGGSVTESKMVRLGDEFIILMHLSCLPDERSKLTSAIRKSKELKPLNIKCKTIARRATGTYVKPISAVRIRAVGEDKPGLLASVSSSIFEAGLSIENVQTGLRKGPNGRTEFVCEADCVATSYMDQQHIEAMVHDLSELKSKHGLDICDVRVQRRQWNPEE